MHGKRRRRSPMKSIWDSKTSVTPSSTGVINDTGDSIIPTSSNPSGKYSPENLKGNAGDLLASALTGGKSSVSAIDLIPAKRGFDALRVASNLIF